MSQPAGLAGADPVDQDVLLRVDRYLQEEAERIGDDVRRGLTQPQKTLPPKYFYDELGSKLFEAICDLPEYYPTRTEEALLLNLAYPLIRRTRPGQLIELGSGASRKTRLLLDALTAICPSTPYVPVDVSESILVTAARALRRDYPRLEVHGIVGDYEHHLRYLPASPCRLAVFLGSTIGNFSAAEGAAFLGALSSQLRAGDMLLIGFDLVKSVDVLNAAYNDSAGVTAQFNRNVLRVLNRELDGDFDLDLFDHDAFFNTDEAQIEMHLRSRQVQKAHLQAIDLEVSFAAGESIRTEISRKFTRATAEDLLCQGGFAPLEWNASANDYFALALAEVQSP